LSYISCDNLSLGYEGKSILDNISFKANKGDYICVLGENGAGKSTLLKTILGMNMPIDGLIEFGDGLCKQDIGYLPQQTEVQRDFPASVEEIVYSGLNQAMG
jgi:zinc transport system ATP-binding protein